MTSSTPSSPRRGARRLIVTFIFFALLLLLASAGSRLWRSVVAPWSTAPGDGAALTGPWVGALALADGTSGTLWLALSDTVDEMEGFGSANLEGSARYCLGSNEGTFELYGGADRTGEIVDLKFLSSEEKPAWLFYPDSGRWQGDTLTLNGRYSFDPSGRHIARSDQPEGLLTVVLQRGLDEDQAAACVE